MRTRRLHRRGAAGLHRRGAAAVEFALTMPILILLLSGVADYGWYFVRANNVARAVREGARYGVTVDQDDSPDDQAESRAEDALEALGFDCSTDCTVTAVTSTAGTTSVLTLTATVNHRSLVGLVPAPPVVTSTLTMAFQDQF